MADPKTGLPSIWVTKLAALLVGESSCWLKAWLPAHYKIEKRERDGGDLVGWKANHTRMIEETVAKLKEQGWVCKVESQNFFRVKGHTAELAGKPDIIARKGAALKVVDCKGGVVRDEHAAQVVLYILAIPLAWNRPDLKLDGEVVYDTHTVPVYWEKAQELRTQAFAMLRKLGEATRPDAVPSEQECRWCDCSKVDCPERWEAPAEQFDIMTSEW